MVDFPIIMTDGKAHNLNGSCLYFIKEKDQVSFLKIIYSNLLINHVLYD